MPSLSNLIMRSALAMLLLCLWTSTVMAADGRDVPPTPKQRLLAQAVKEPAKNAAGEKEAIEKGVVEKAIVLDAGQEASAVAFVRENHAELASLLDNLKESRPKEYQKAVRDLARVRERLAQMKANNGARYDLELAVWKTESRIQLLAARLHMSDSQELRDQIRQAINERFDLKLAVLKLERDMFRDKADKAEAQIQKLDQQRSDIVEKQVQALAKPSGTTTVKAPNKSEKKSPDKKNPNKDNPRKEALKAPAKKP